MNRKEVDSLVSLGLTEKEAKVYLAILAMKKGTALTISKKAGVKRPTTYLVLQSLEEKRLVAHTVFREVRDYRVLSLGSLKKYVRQQSGLVEKNIGKMEKMYEERKNKLRLRVYEGVLSAKTIFEKSLREKKRMHIIGDKKLFVDNFGDYWNYYLKRSAQLGIRPSFKECAGMTCLCLWSDKTAFLDFGDPIQLFGFRNKELHGMYMNIWKKC